MPNEHSEARIRRAEQLRAMAKTLSDPAAAKTLEQRAAELEAEAAAPAKDPEPPAGDV